MLAALCLPVLGGAAAVLALVSCACLAAKRLPQPVLPAASLICCALVLLFAGGALVAGVWDRMALPVGLGLLQGSLALDPLGAFFLLPIGLAGLAASWAALDRPMTPAQPALTAAALFVVLAGNTALAVLAIAAVALLTSPFTARFPLSKEEKPPGDASLFRITGAVLIATGLAILAAAGQASFAAFRTAPLDNWPGAAAAALVLAGAMPLAGWAPWRHTWSAQADCVALTAVPAAGLYLVARIVLDLSGPATPVWWGAPLLIVGAATAIAGALAALRAPALGGVVAGLATQQAGWMLTGLGLAAAARGVDLLPLASLALGGTMLETISFAIIVSLAALAVQAAADGGGSQMLDAQGGLAHSMKVTAVAILIAGLSFALVPLSAGFAGAWMLVQALFAAPRIGGWPLELVFVLTAIALASSAGLGSAAMVRLGGMAFLGRPRTPRGAAAQDAPRLQRYAMLTLSAAAAILGIAPGLVLRLAAAVPRMLVQAGQDGQAGWASLQVQRDAPGYAPLLLAVLIAGGLAALALAVRAARLPSPERTPAWEDGFAAPPAWMPFGDPATQLSAAALTTILPRPAFARVRVPRPRLHWDAPAPRLRINGSQWAVLALAVAGLLLAASLDPV